MSERFFRLILGLVLIFLLFFKLHTVLYVYIGLLMFEGFTNFRIPILVSRLRYGKDYHEASMSGDHTSKINFEAERALRLVIAGLLILSIVLAPESLWFLSWFIGFGLSVAGITSICPMAMLMVKLGFRE